MVLLQGNSLAHHINCPSPFLLLLDVKPSLHLHHIHLYHKGCHPSHPSLQGNHFPNQILLGNCMKYHISSLLQDRKSTRLNSSHLGISYAVFCLKKKNNNNISCDD